MTKINGFALAAVLAGSLSVYAGITGKDIPSAVRDVIKGESPTAAPQNAPITGGTTLTSPAGGTITAQGGQPSGSDAANQLLGRFMAAGYGWGTGDQWTALNNIVMAESGWSDTVENPSSDAAGIAQKITGWSSDYQKGNAAQQIAWMLRYIKSRYGTPAAAWQFHLANGWY